jgi:hypothetical protein
MTEVPCSVEGCGAGGTRWAIQRVRVARYELSVVPKDVEVPRFVCDEHAKELAAAGAVITPPLLPDSPIRFPPAGPLT